VRVVVGGGWSKRAFALDLGVRIMCCIFNISARFVSPINISPVSPQCENRILRSKDEFQGKHIHIKRKKYMKNLSCIFGVKFSGPPLGQGRSQKPTRQTRKSPVHQPAENGANREGLVVFLLVLQSRQLLIWRPRKGLIMAKIDEKEFGRLTAARANTVALSRQKPFASG
jgi:hypothetical protein